MDIKPVSCGVKAVAFCLLVASGGLGGAAFAASSTSSTSHLTADRAGSQANIGTAAAQTHSSSAGYELDYFHAYNASKTYAIRLKNGLQASFDFENGTARLFDGNTWTTIPLEDVLLQANNGNVQAAAEMWDEMYDSISAANADAIMAYAGPGSTGTHWFPLPPRYADGIGQFNSPLWGMPGQGDCWPLPSPCHEWSGGLSNWGAYNQWWSSPFGDPPPTSQPPRPDGCAPNDTDCIIRENDRQEACDDLPSDTAWTYGLAAIAGAACGLAETGAGAVGCAAALASGARSNQKRIKDSKRCHTP